MTVTFSAEVPDGPDHYTEVIATGALKPGRKVLPLKDGQGRILGDCVVTVAHDGSVSIDSTSMTVRAATPYLLPSVGPYFTVGRTA